MPPIESILLKEIYNILNRKIKDDISLFKGFKITGLSLKKPLGTLKQYGIFFYHDAFTSSKEEEFQITLQIPIGVINNYKNSIGGDISPTISFEIVIDSLYIGKRGKLLIQPKSIRESGLSNKGMLHKRLTSFCNKNHYLNRKKKKPPYLITSVLALTSISSDIKQDITSNINIPEDKIKIVQCPSSNEIAYEINEATSQDYDVIVLYRGGFDDESMSIFSDKNIIKAIVDSNIPVASALGHEADHPFICDITDMNYSTPSSFGVEVNQCNLEVKNSLKSLESNTCQILNDISHQVIKNIENTLNTINLLVLQLHERGISRIDSSHKDVVYMVDRLYDQLLGRIDRLLDYITSTCRYAGSSLSSIETIRPILFQLHNRATNEVASLHNEVMYSVNSIHNNLFDDIEKIHDEVKLRVDEIAKIIKQTEKIKWGLLIGILIIIAYLWLM